MTPHEIIYYIGLIFAVRLGWVLKEMSMEEKK